MSSLPLDPVDDVERAASRTVGKSLAVEGIPMVLALEDVSAAHPTGGDHALRAAGAGSAELGVVLAQRLRTYHAVLFPAADGDAYWPIHDALVVVSDAHGPRPS